MPNRNRFITPDIREELRNSWLIQPYRQVRNQYWFYRDYILDRLAVIQPKLDSKLLLTSIPKSGTHLIRETLSHIEQIKREPLMLPPRVPVREFHSMLQGMPRNRYAWGHLGFNPHTEKLIVELDYSVLLMLRDPRDVVVSYVDHESPRFL